MLTATILNSRLGCRLTLLAVLLLPMLINISCLRERPSEKPPIHLNPNMDTQPKYKAYRESKFFDDGSSMRTPPAGTLAIEAYHADTRYYAGKETSGAFVKKSPVAMTLPQLQRGQERFNIYCAPCHSRLGDGNGLVVQRGMLRPVSFHDARIKAVEDGYIFDVITHGIRNMPSYQQQIPAADRWAIVAYVRALQLSQAAPASAVPAEIRQKLLRK